MQNVLDRIGRYYLVAVMIGLFVVLAAGCGSNPPVTVMIVKDGASRPAQVIYKDE